MGMRKVTHMCDGGGIHYNIRFFPPNDLSTTEPEAKIEIQR